MSVRVSDLLTLPSLRQANVVAGQKGLSKFVSSISVLESINPGLLTSDIFGKADYLGSEIVITGFLNCLDDVDTQCENVRRLAQGQEAGLILFYVGIYMKQIDQKLINLCNELDFVLIQMPAMKNLRYSEVISEVTEFIYDDRTRNQSIVTDILAEMSILPEHQRSIKTVLRMISDRIFASIILTDESLHILNVEAWPQSVTALLESKDMDLKQYIDLFGEQEFPLLPSGKIYHISFYRDGGNLMRLFLISEGKSLSSMILEQVEDIVRICINIWGREHGNIAPRELIRAILQDDPLKMHRLSDIYGIDVSSIHEMFILRSDDFHTLKDYKEFICERIKTCTCLVIADFYEDEYLLFSSTPQSQMEMEKAINEIVSNFNLTLTRCSSLYDTSDVRKAYLCHRHYLNDAQRIYPNHRWFTIGDIEYAMNCHKLIEEGEESLRFFNDLLSKLALCSEEWNAVDTLSVYLLDADCSITQTSKLLFLHKNTVKYRLKMISNHLGYRVDKMPECMKVYQALALNRMLR